MCQQVRKRCTSWCIDAWWPSFESKMIQTHTTDSRHMSHAQWPREEPSVPRAVFHSKCSTSLALFTNCPSMPEHLTYSLQTCRASHIVFVRRRGHALKWYSWSRPDSWESLICQVRIDRIEQMRGKFCYHQYHPLICQSEGCDGCSIHNSTSCSRPSSLCSFGYHHPSTWLGIRWHT